MMKRFFLLSLISVQQLFANPTLEKYLSYLEQLAEPPGNHLNGEIEVITDPAEISRIQKMQKERFLKKGFSEQEATEFSRVGIISEDPDWIWLRDATALPHGTWTYGRLLSKARGVAILPILTSNKIALILTYRHATRSWELELPRGGIDAQESPEEGALRELQEETGLSGEISFLGQMTSDSGIVACVTPIYAVHVSAEGVANRDFCEAIADVFFFSKDEIKGGLLQGHLEVLVNGKKQLVPIRDAFLTFALLQAEIRKFI